MKSFLDEYESPFHEKNDVDGEQSHLFARITLGQINITHLDYRGVSTAAGVLSAGGMGQMI